MTKQTIEVEGLPEGSQSVAYRYPKNGLELCFLEGQIKLAKSVNCAYEQLIIEKIQSHRIVIEATLEPNSSGNCQEIIVKNKFGISRIAIASDNIWKQVKETDIPLTNDETKLSLSVNDSIKWAENLILQLDENHQGRNSWICHYGRSKQAEEARKTSIFEYMECDGRFNISIRKDK